MQTINTIAQIIYYIAMSIAGPLAVIAYLKARSTDRLEKEYKTYDELDNRFFEYQKLALEYYDLDILDVPNNDPSLAFDKKRKQEMVAYAILFSLFERSYLMFSNQADMFRKRQWSGWKHFLNDFIRRQNVRTAWELSKETYDTDFQKFMDRKIADVLAKPVLAAVAKPTQPAAAQPAPVPAHASPPQGPHGSLGAAATNAVAQVAANAP
jgi:hypothetical protein